MYYRHPRQKPCYGLTFFSGVALGLILSLWIQAAQAENRRIRDNKTTINQGD